MQTGRPQIAHQSVLLYKIINMSISIHRQEKGRHSCVGIPDYHTHIYVYIYTNSLRELVVVKPFLYKIIADIQTIFASHMLQWYVAMGVNYTREP